MTVWTLIWGVIFSSIGLGFFVYGRRQRAVSPLLCGVVLMLLPYFAPNIIIMILAGVGLVILPFFFRV